MNRLRTKPWAKEHLSKSPFFVSDFNFDTKNWSDIFNNKNNLEVEIGHGKGDFLIQKIKKHRNVNFIGIEKFPSVQVIALKKIEELAIHEKIDNLKFLSIDGQKMEDFFSKDSISKIYINFPDPWPKTRHAKRRLVNKKFLYIYHNVLVNRGIIEFKTDQLPLFEFALDEIRNMNLFKILRVSYDLHSEEKDVELTEYENRFILQNKPIYYLKLEKI